MTGPQIAWRDNWIRLERAIMRSAEGYFAATLEPDAGVAPANPRFASSKSPTLEVGPSEYQAQEAWFTATEEGSVWVY